MGVMPRRALTDEQLAAAYRRDGRRLLVWLTRRTYDPQLAVDLVGETYARALATRRRFSGDPADAGAVAAWTWGIARNVLGDALRRGHAERRALRRLGAEPPLLEPLELRRIEELAELGSLRAALAGALEELSAEQRDAVRLRIVDELAYPDVAARLGISEQAARARVSRALRSLAGALDELRPGAAT
jgi:RNA polymerase sigma factor (sigma-70 family)